MREFFEGRPGLFGAFESNDINKVIFINKNLLISDFINEEAGLLL